MIINVLYLRETFYLRVYCLAAVRIVVCVVMLIMSVNPAIAVESAFIGPQNIVKEFVIPCVYSMIHL